MLENPAVPVELIGPAEAVLVQDPRPVLLAVVLRTRSAIAAHHPAQVPLLGAEEDLAAAAAETTRAPAAAEAAIAWAVADTAAAVEDDEDERTGYEEKTNEIKNRRYDFVENYGDRLLDC